MSYRIEYGKDPRYRVPVRSKKWSKVLLVLGIIAAGAWLGFYAVQYIGMKNFLPGDPAVTGAALDALVENWKNGVPAGEAFTAFCEEIVANAEILR